jgi:hypothetical protein
MWLAEGLGFRVAWVWAQEVNFLLMWLRKDFPTAHFTTVALHLAPPVSIVFCDSLAPRWMLEVPGYSTHAFLSRLILSHLVRLIYVIL